MKGLVGHGLLFIALLCAWAAPAQTSRTEAVLSWDDGVLDSPYHTVTGHPGQAIAVGFQAPEWACWLTGIHYYIADDFSPAPTESFMAYVWKPAPGTPTLPGEFAIAGVTSGDGYPENAWLEVSLPVAVDLTDASAFPDRVFFVGLEWVNRLQPLLGEDHSDPVDHMSWRFDWVVWELREDGDTMIRAVVSDSWVSPVDPETWSRVKALFR